MSELSGVGEMPEKSTQVREMLVGVLGEFEELRGRVGTVEFYTVMAERLSGLVGKRPVWTWRYVQGVEKGTIGASQVFGEAVRRLGEELDGRKAELTGYGPVRVLARAGEVAEGAVVLGSSKVCAGSGCQVVFVPRVPWQRFCSRECRGGPRVLGGTGDRRPKTEVHGRRR